jgi:hypothetical protein
MPNRDVVTAGREAAPSGKSERDISSPGGVYKERIGPISDVLESRGVAKHRTGPEGDVLESRGV